jgi:hypothetical protein
VVIGKKIGAKFRRRLSWFGDSGWSLLTDSCCSNVVVNTGLTVGLIWFIIILGEFYINYLVEGFLISESSASIQKCLHNCATERAVFWAGRFDEQIPCQIIGNLKMEINKERFGTDVALISWRNRTKRKSKKQHFDIEPLKMVIWKSLKAFKTTLKKLQLFARFIDEPQFAFQKLTKSEFKQLKKCSYYF